MSDLCKKCDHRKAVYRKSAYRFSKYRIYFCTARGLLNLNVQECSLYVKREVKADVSDKRLKESEKEIRYLLKKLDKG